jgi:glutamine---fructose-6-phosphate transaminase (isomerizing)
VVHNGIIENFRELRQELIAGGTRFETETDSISAGGTAYYAGLVAKYWFERLAHLPTEVDIASEFRYRGPPLKAGDVTIVVSQSGETADTLASLRYAREQRQHIVSVLNVPTSTIARDSDVAAGRARGVLSREDECTFAQARVPGHIIGALGLEPQIEHLAHDLAKSRHSSGAPCYGRLDLQ